MTKGRVLILRDGKPRNAFIEPMFKTHGPLLINGVRLDQLSKVQILIDSSTTTRHETGQAKTKTDSVIGRAVAGGLVFGAAGAIIGGTTGGKDSTIKSVSTETRNTELTVELTFSDGSSMIALLRDMDSYHWLLGMASRTPMSDEEIEKARLLAKQTEEIALKVMGTNTDENGLLTQVDMKSVPSQRYDPSQNTKSIQAVLNPQKESQYKKVDSAGWPAAIGIVVVGYIVAENLGGFAAFILTVIGVIGFAINGAPSKEMAAKNINTNWTKFTLAFFLLIFIGGFTTLKSCSNVTNSSSDNSLYDYYKKHPDEFVRDYDKLYKK